MPTQTLQSQILDLAQAIGEDVKELRTHHTYDADDAYDTFLEYYEQAISGNIIPTYPVAYSLGNATSSNNSASAKENKQYSTTISPTTGYQISSITVMMGGVDITDTAVSGNNISIDSVTGEITITVTTEVLPPDVYSVSYTLGNSTSTNSQTTVEDSSSFTAVITPNVGYNIDSISVTMGGNPISAIGNTINIPSVNGDIIIVVTTSKSVYTISNTLTHTTASTDVISVEYGSSYMNGYTAESGYEISAARVFMGGSDITSTAWNAQTGTVSIPSVTGNIQIVVTSTLIGYSVSVTATNATGNNDVTSVEYGSTYVNTFTADSGYEIDTVSVIMGGADITASAYNQSSKTVIIANVTGNVTIVVVSTKINPMDTYVGVMSSADMGITIDTANLSSGTYTMRYIDSLGNPIESFEEIGTFEV